MNNYEARKINHMIDVDIFDFGIDSYQFDLFWRGFHAAI